MKKIILLSALGITINSNAQWVQNSFTGEAVTNVETVGDDVYASTYGFITGTGDLFKSSDNGLTWTESDSGLPAISNKGAFNDFIFSGTDIYVATGNGIFISSNSGATWTSKGMTGTEVLAIAISGNRLFAGTYSGIYISNDNGSTWNPGTLTDQVKTIFVNGNTILSVGGSSGSVQRSTDNGATWTGTGLNNQDPREFAIIGNTIFAASYGFGVFKSTDDGVTWSQAGTNGYFTSLAVSGNILFAGKGGAGVKYTEDFGLTWIDISSNLPGGSFTNSLAVSNNVIFAATSKNSLADTVGNGVWVRPFSDFVGTMEKKSMEQTIAIFPNPSKGNFNISSSGNNNSIVVYNTFGEKIYNSILTAGYSKIDLKNYPDGIYFVQLKDGDKIYTRKILKE